jgi:hypothetical protein
MAGISHSHRPITVFSTRPGLNSSGLPWNRTTQTQIKSDSQVLSEGDPLPPSRRLVVIVPDSEIDFLSLPRRIWSLACPDNREVLLLCKPCREENELHSRVHLTTLAAHIRDPRVPVETQQILGMSLLQAAAQCARPDDVFVCFEEHRLPGLLKKNYLAGPLAQQTGRPVYTLKGPVSEMTDPASALVSDFILLALSLLTLIAFFVLQVWLDQHAAGAVRTITQVLSVFAEIFIIAACANKTFRI